MSIITGPIGMAAGLPNTLDETNASIALGSRIEGNDGRAWRYAKAGANLVVGNLLQGPAEVTANENLAFTAAAAGVKQVVSTTTVTVTKDQYAGGYVSVTTAPDLGGTYRIKGHAAATAGVITLDLEDPIQVAWTTATRADLVANPFNGVIQWIASPTAAPVGVAVNNITSGQYGWIQVAGPCSVTTDSGGLTVGAAVSGSNATAGTVEVGVAGQAYVGYAMTGVAGSETGLVYLKIS